MHTFAGRPSVDEASPGMPSNQGQEIFEFVLGHNSMSERGCGLIANCKLSPSPPPKCACRNGCCTAAVGPAVSLCQQVLHKVKHTRMVGCGEGGREQTPCHDPTHPDTPGQETCQNQVLTINKLANKVRHPLRLSGPVRPMAIIKNVIDVCLKQIK